MNQDLLNILPDNNNGMDDQKLLDYLNGKLTGEAKHEVEKWMADNEIASDAVEGLEKIKDKKSLQQYLEQLNNQLQIQLEKKQTLRQKKRIKEYPWTYIAIILILSLCVLGYIVIRKFLHQF